MRAFLVICLLFIHSAWTHETGAEESIGWHQRVGMKNSEIIKLSEVTLKNRIVGGAVAPVYAHPYLAGLLIDIIGFSSPSACGGSLLSPNRILTAAHCWFDGFNQAHRITAVLGSQFLFHGGVRVFPSAIAIHPTYDFRTFANDIAMLYLPVHIPFSAQIQPIALPSGPLLHMDYTNETVIAAGYGRYSDVTNPTTNTMARNVLLEVIELQKCRRFYGDVVLDSNICTNGYGGVGICQGDSGGPLTMNVNGESVLIGKHHPRIDFPTRYLSFGETLRANCTTAPAVPAPHITWFINGRKMDELVAHSHKFRVPMSERNGRRGLQRTFEYETGMSSPPPLLTLTHASHLATRPPGCSLKETQMAEVKENEEINVIHMSSRHKSRKPSKRDLYVTVSELQIVATGRLEITCVSTIPEFRSIEDRFADVRNDTVIVDVIKPSTLSQPSANLTTADSSTSGSSKKRRNLFSSLMCIIIIYLLTVA
ncbi:unnamed protein product [Spodoptera exigua]|nr:unnamed protein product [Spodoptera exigua]